MGFNSGFKGLNTMCPIPTSTVTTNCFFFQYNTIVSRIKKRDSGKTNVKRCGPGTNAFTVGPSSPIQGSPEAGYYRYVIPLHLNSNTRSLVCWCTPISQPLQTRLLHDA